MLLPLVELTKDHYEGDTLLPIRRAHWEVKFDGIGLVDDYAY